MRPHCVDVVRPVDRSLWQHWDRIRRVPSHQIALRTIAIGGIDAVVGLVLLEETGSEWLLLLSGIVPALLGALVLTQLGIGALGARYYLAITSISASVLLLALACRLRACVGRQ